MERGKCAQRLKSGCNGIWWCHKFKPILSITSRPFRSDTTSSLVSMTYCYMMMALFNERMSTQTLISFGFFGLGSTSEAVAIFWSPQQERKIFMATTIDEIQPTGSMMSSFLSCLSFSSTCFLKWNGIWRCGCARFTVGAPCLHVNN